MENALSELHRIGRALGYDVEPATPKQIADFVIHSFRVMRITEGLGAEPLGTHCSCGVAECPGSGVEHDDRTAVRAEAQRQWDIQRGLLPPDPVELAELAPDHSPLPSGDVD